MSNNVSEPPTQPQILASFSLLTGLLGIFFYFIGWIYRWAYFGFFQIEITSLNFSLESFIFVPLQVFFGSYGAFFKTVLAFAISIVLTQFTFWLLSFLSVKLPERLRSLLGVIPQPLGKELIIVFWLLLTFFWLARAQGTNDAYRDAVNDTSLRPIIAFVTPSDLIPLGRKFDDRLTRPSLEGYQIIGDKRLFDDLRRRDINNFIDPKNPTVWRLLIQTNGSIYVFPALSANSGRDLRPPILAIRKSARGDQLMILAPEIVE